MRTKRLLSAKVGLRGTIFLAGQKHVIATVSYIPTKQTPEYKLHLFVRLNTIIRYHHIIQHKYTLYLTISSPLPRELITYDRLSLAPAPAAYRTASGRKPSSLKDFQVTPTRWRCTKFAFMGSTYTKCINLSRDVTYHIIDRQAGGRHGSFF